MCVCAKERKGVTAAVMMMMMFITIFANRGFKARLMMFCKLYAPPIKSLWPKAPRSSAGLWAVDGGPPFGLNRAGFEWRASRHDSASEIRWRTVGAPSRAFWRQRWRWRCWPVALAARLLQMAGRSACEACARAGGESSCAVRGAAQVTLASAPASLSFSRCCCSDRCKSISHAFASLLDAQRCA